MSENETYTPPKAAPEHEWLHRLAGEWTYETPEPHASKGTETFRILEGGLWTVGEASGTMPGGGPSQTIMTIGYDLKTKRFVGSWVGSMMSTIWIYDGELDASGNSLILNSRGPSMADDGTEANYRDIIEFVSDDERTMRGEIEDADGNWSEFMRTTYRRNS